MKPRRLGHLFDCLVGALQPLSATRHPSTRPADAEHAEVEFVARSRLDGRGQRLHESSRFVREGGRWFYVDGDLK